MASSPEQNNGNAPSAAERRIQRLAILREQATKKYDPPWKRVLLRWLQPGQSLLSIYRLMGLSKSRVYWLSRGEEAADLRLSLASQMARALGAPVGRFLEDLATEQGIPPIEGRPMLPLRSLKPAKQRSRTCRHCRKKHPTSQCPALANNSAVQQLRARGAAFANRESER